MTVKKDKLDLNREIVELLTERAHWHAKEGHTEGAQVLTKAVAVIETLRKDVNRLQVMSEYQEQCKVLAEDKLRQELMS